MSLSIQDLEEDKDTTSLWIINERAGKGYGPVPLSVMFHGAFQQVVIKETAQPQNLIEQLPSRAAILKCAAFRNLVNARYIRALTERELQEALANPTADTKGAEHDEAAAFYNLGPGDPGYVG